MCGAGVCRVCVCVWVCVCVFNSEAFGKIIFHLYQRLSIGLSSIKRISSRLFASSTLPFFVAPLCQLSAPTNTKVIGNNTTRCWMFNVKWIYHCNIICVIILKRIYQSPSVLVNNLLVVSSKLNLLNICSHINKNYIGMKTQTWVSTVQFNSRKPCYIGFPSQFNIYSIQTDFQVIQFCANLNAHSKVYFNLQIRRFNFNNCSSDLVHQSFNLIKQEFNRQKGSINFIKSARN